jgi:hypothetical protein
VSCVHGSREWIHSNFLPFEGMNIQKGRGGEGSGEGGKEGRREGGREEGRKGEREASSTFNQE